MLRLLIDPLAEPVQMALYDGEKIIAIASSLESDRALALDVAFSTLDLQCAPEEIVVVNGPGNFTAIRAGIGYARGLGLAYGVPTRGISILEVDQCFADDKYVVRDARGGRGFLLRDSQISLRELTSIEGNYVSFDPIEGITPLIADPITRMNALGMLAENDHGTCPAKANYIRPVDAAPSSIIPPKITDMIP